MPWYVVDATSLSSMCYRTGVNGKPTASARGYSLVEFVQSRLAGSMTTREMIGTWVGGLLCDDYTAVDTIAALGDRALAPKANVSVHFSRYSDCARVPLEYAWMYEAAKGIGIAEWDGQRTIDGRPRYSVDDDDGSWAITLPLAELYSAYAGDVAMSTNIVQFMSRLHAIDVDREFIRVLHKHAEVVVTHGCTEDGFDRTLTPMLPGYNYLASLLPSVRYAAVQVLACNPGISSVMAYAGEHASVDGSVSVESMCADAVRSMLFAGMPLTSVRRVGHSNDMLHDQSDEPGYCYMCLFQPQYRRRARKLLRAYPTMWRLLSPRYRGWFIPRVFDRVIVTNGSYVGVRGKKQMVLHLSLGGDGVTLRSYLRAMRFAPFGSRARLVRVGQAGVCYSNSWYVSAIIAWTIVGVCLFGVLVWLLYMRLSGGKRGPGRRGY